MDCEKCKEETCEYKKELLLIPSNKELEEE